MYGRPHFVGMHPNILAIVHRCVEEGVLTGWDEAYEGIENPTIEQVQETIHSAIMRELHMYFEFEACES